VLETPERVRELWVNQQYFQQYLRIILLMASPSTEADG
jgi:hypothetical protein